MPSHPRYHPVTTIFFACLAVAIVLCGCVSTSDGPNSEYSHIALSASSSPSVEVFSPRFRSIDGRVYLDGSVRRAFGAKSTKDSSLQVDFLSAEGALLATQIMAFWPAELPMRTSHRYNEGHYLVPVLEIFVGTTRIEVRAIAKAILSSTPR